MAIVILSQNPLGTFPSCRTASRAHLQIFYKTIVGWVSCSWQLQAFLTGTFGYWGSMEEREINFQLNGSGENVERHVT